HARARAGRSRALRQLQPQPAPALSAGADACAMDLQLNYWLTLLWALYLVALSVWILLQKRPPVSTLAWILSLAALPVLGFAIYHWLGPVRIKRQTLKRRRSRRLLEREPQATGD